MPLHLLRVCSNRQSLQLAICLLFRLVQISKGLLTLSFGHQPRTRRVLRHLIINCLLFELILPLILELVNVAWHLAIVLVLSRYAFLLGSGSTCSLRWLHFEDGLFHVCFHMIGRLSWVHRGHVRSTRHGFFVGYWTTNLLVALLARQYLAASILRGPILHRAGAGSILTSATT